MVGVILRDEARSCFMLDGPFAVTSRDGMVTRVRTPNHTTRLFHTQV